MPALIGQGVIVNDRSSSGGGTVNSVTGNIVDNTDPVNPVVTQQQADWKETNPVETPTLFSLCDDRHFYRPWYIMTFYARGIVKRICF